MNKIKHLLAPVILFAFLASTFSPIASPVFSATFDKTKPKIVAKAGFGKYIATGKTITNSTLTVSVSDKNLKSTIVTKNGKKIKMPAKNKFVSAGKYIVTVKDKSNNTSVYKFTIKKVAITHANLISLYYNLIDFLRTTALGGAYVTPSVERSRVATLVKTNWTSITPTIQNTVIQAAQVALNINLFYLSCTTAEKTKLRAAWKRIMLSPNFIYAPLKNPNTYRSGSTISFNYPSDWTGGEAADANNVSWLFLGKNGASSAWENVMNTKNSPSGSLSAIFPITSDVNGKSALEVARLYAKTYAPTFKEINKITTTLGAVVVVSGKFSGQTAEKFFWIVVIPGSATNYSMSRMGGKVSEAATLVPSFFNMLNTLNWSSTPVGGGGGSSAGDAFGTAWSRVSTAVVANIWAPSDNGGY